MKPPVDFVGYHDSLATKGIHRQGSRDWIVASGAQKAESDHGHVTGRLPLTTYHAIVVEERQYLQRLGTLCADATVCIRNACLSSRTVHSEGCPRSTARLESAAIGVRLLRTTEWRRVCSTLSRSRAIKRREEISERRWADSGFSRVLDLEFVLVLALDLEGPTLLERLMSALPGSI